MRNNLTKSLFVLLLFVALPFAAYCQLPVPLWVNDIGGPGTSKPTGLITDNQNNIYITGLFNGTVDFDPSAGVKNLTPVGGFDTYIAKYTSAGALVWVTSVGGAGLDQANCMTVDNNGNVTVVGQFDSPVLTAGAFTLTNQGAEDAFIIHLDANGNVNWAKSFGSFDTDRGEEVSADAQGNLTMTSIFQDNFVLNGNNIFAGGGSFNGLIIKYDINGNILWYVNLGNTGDAEVYGNGTDSGGNVVVSGIFTGTVDFDPNGAHDFVNPPVPEYFVAKYSPAGKLIWVYNWGGSFINNQSVISIDSNNNIYFGAAFSSPVIFNGGALNPQGQDIFLAKFSSAGAFQFAKDIGSTGSSIYTYQMRNDPNNNDVYITGYFSGTIDFDPSAAVANVSDHGQRDFFIGKYDPNGNYLWAFGEGSANCNQTLGVELGVDHDSNVISGGSFCSSVNFDPSNCTSDILTAINGTSDTYIAKYTPSSSTVISNNILAAPAGTTFCGSGDPAVITASTPAGGSGIYTYQWQSSPDNVTFTDIQGATLATYDPPVTGSTIYYRRVVSSNCALPINSNVITIQVQPVLANNALTAPAIVSFCANGDPAVITGSTPTGGSGVYTYQWQSSPDNTTFTDIPGAIAADYDPPAVIATTYYQRVVTSGFCTTPFISNAITINVQAALGNNTITAPSVTTFCGPFIASTGGSSGNQPIIISANTPTGGNGIYNFQWQSSPDGITFTDISGAAGSSYSFNQLSATTYFRRVVTSGVCVTPLISNVVEMVIQPVLATNNITVPAVASFCSAGDPTIINGSAPTGGSGTYTYQWQSSADNATFTDLAGATSATYDPPVLNATTWYRRMVTSGACTTPFVSNVVEIIVAPNPQTPAFSSATINLCAGGTTTIDIASPQQGVTYQWYNSPSKTTLVFTGTSFTTPVLNANITYYVDAISGTCTSPASGTVTVNVSSIPATPTATSNSAVVCSGSSATLSISGPQAGITYNWYTAPTGGTSVFSGTDFITPAISSNATYYAEAANAVGCTSASRAAITVTVNPQPSVSAQGTSVCPGTTATLTASSSDPNAVINWYTAASGGGAVFTGPSFTTPALNSNTTFYAEAADNTTGCVSASRATAQVQIIQPLAAPDVTVGSTTTSSVTFQWDAVNGATGYQVSTDGGQTFTDPSSGSNGLTHTVSGLQAQQTVTIVVRAIGGSACDQSANSASVTGTAASPLGDEIFVANAFTPNGDGKNDIVYVRGTNIKSLKFYIYDQWGELIYTSLNQASGWDGTYKGSKEPAGVYVYYVDAMMNDGKQLRKKGTVTLLR